METQRSFLEIFKVNRDNDGKTADMRFMFCCGAAPGGSVSLFPSCADPFEGCHV